MALELKVCTMSGPLCGMSVASSSTILDLKVAIEEKEGIPAHEQKLLARNGWELSVLTNLKTIAECGLEAGAQVVLVRTQPYNGKYMVEITWNGDVQLEILGGHAKLELGNQQGFEAEIQWDAADPHKATFQGHRVGTSEWAQRHTKSAHKEEEGLWENFKITFNGDVGAGGFTGVFQRQYEGPLDMTGTWVEDPA